MTDAAMVIPKALFDAAPTPSKAREALAVLSILTRHLEGSDGACCLSAPELGQIAHLDSGNLSRCLQLLETVGALGRERIPGRGRSKRIVLTRAGAVPLAIIPSPAGVAREWRTTAFFRIATVEMIRADLAASADLAAVPLMRAAAVGSAAVVHTLVEAGADTAAATDKGMTPLHAAAWYGNAGAIPILLDAGAALEAPLNNGERPLHAAARNGTPATVNALLDGGADRKAQDDKGHTPWDCAQTNSKLDKAVRDRLQP